MKISDVIVKRYWDNQRPDMKHADGYEVITVEVETDAGISGTGFLSLPVFSHGHIGDVIATLLERNLRNIVLGENPLHTEDVWERMYSATWKLGGKGIFRKCIGAIDIALWDIKGKAANMPVSGLFGGHKQHVKTYANVAHQLPPNELAAKAVEYTEQGHTALKIRCGTTAVSIEEADERVRLVREAIGPDIKLMVDVNGSWDAETAIQQLKKWEKYDLYWLEEPVPYEDTAGYARVKQFAGSTYIAGGEQHEGLNEFRHLIEQNALDIAQPDAATTGGITDWMKIYNFATMHNIPVAPWNLQQVHIHMAVGLPNVQWIEYFTPDRGFFQNRLFDGPTLKEVRKDDGIYFEAPDVIGLGMELNEAVAEETLLDE